VPLLVNYVVPLLGKFLSIVLSVAATVLKALGPAIDDLSSSFQDLLDWLQPVFDWLSKIAGIAGDVIGALGSIHIPGINMATSSAAAGRAGAPVSVTIQTGVGDPVATGRQVAKYLGAYQLRGGTV